LVKNNNLIVYGTLGIAAAILLSKGKVGSYVGQSVGKTIGGSASGVVEGVTEGLLVEPYNWAMTYKHYIPIFDDLAFWAARPDLRGKMSANDYGKKNLGW
jgi:hypothetical protein